MQQHRHHHSLGDGLRLNSRVHLIAYEAAQLTDPPAAIRRALNLLSIKHRLGADEFGGLVEFEEARPVIDEGCGQGWLSIHLTATFGLNSTDFDGRFKWVAERAELWRRIASDPLAHVEWADASVPDPLAALAAVFEWAAFLDFGPGMPSRLPVIVEDRHLGGFMLSPLPSAADEHVRLRELSCAAFEAREAGIEVSEDGAGTFATHAATAWDLVHFLQDGLRVAATIAGPVPCFMGADA
ncbi:DNA-directed RNA polymerase [Methylobacterium sp. E-045]|uniref:DNA-directed RNA polymerase n=1 Tax=Methylobacterium sp. E-045 TaxID=2836575 RepID=UPI001FB9F2E3|nr:DNA-directed RNA polymerase [Methylobacterium sp. E-045]MCJ2132296.1 hypothetical protein [Methylobacterium sp. E-045]